MDNKRKRSSILKRRPILDVPSPTQTYTRQSRRISFSDKNSVKEFMAGEEVATIWGTSYEEETENMNVAVAAVRALNNSNQIEADSSIMLLRNKKFVVKTPCEANVKLNKSKNDILPEYDKENIMVGAVDIFQSNEASKSKEKSNNDITVSPTINIEEVDMDLSVCVDNTEKPTSKTTTESSTTVAKSELHDSLDISLTAEELIQYNKKKPNPDKITDCSNDIDSVQDIGISTSSNTEISTNPYSSFSFFEKERKKMKRISKCTNGLIDISLADIRDFSECSSTQNSLRNSGQKCRNPSIESNMQIVREVDNVKKRETILFGNETINAVSSNIESTNAENNRKTLVFNNDSMYVDNNNGNLSINEAGSQMSLSNDYKIADAMDISNIEEEQTHPDDNKKIDRNRKTIHYEDASLNTDTCSNHSVHSNKTFKTENKNINIFQNNRQTQIFENYNIEKEDFDNKRKNNSMKRKTQIFDGEDVIQDSHYNKQNASEAKRRTVYFDKAEIEIENKRIQDTENELLTYKQNSRKTEIFESDDIVQDSHYNKPITSGMARKTINFNKEDIDIENEEIYAETNEISKNRHHTQIFESEDVSTSSVNTKKANITEPKRNTMYFENANIDEERLLSTGRNQGGHHKEDEMDISLVLEETTSHPQINFKNKTKHFNESKYLIEESGIENKEIYTETNEMSKNGYHTQIFEGDEISPNSINTNKVNLTEDKRKTTHFANDYINEESMRKSHSKLADGKRKTTYEATNMQFDEQSDGIQEETRSRKRTTHFANTYINEESMLKSHSTLADGKRKTTYEVSNMQFDEQSDDIQEESKSHKSFNSSKKYKSTLVENDQMDESAHAPNVIAKTVNNIGNRQTIFFGGAYIEEDKINVNKGERFITSSHRVPFATKNKRQTICEPNDMDIDQETQYNTDHSNNVCISDKDNLNHKSVSHINRTQVIENKEDAPKNNETKATIFLSNNEQNEDRMDTTLSPQNNDPPAPNVDKQIKARKTIIFGECDNKINPDQSNLMLDSKRHATTFLMDQSKPDLPAESRDNTGISFQINQCFSKPSILDSEDIVEHSHYNKQSAVEAKRRTVYFDKSDIEIENEGIQDKGNELHTEKRNFRKTQIFESDDIVQDSHYNKPSISGMTCKTINSNKENIDMENEETKEISKNKNRTQIFDSDDISPTLVNTNKASITVDKRKTTHFENANIDVENLSIEKDLHKDDKMEISLMMDATTSKPDNGSKNITKRSNESQHLIKENNSVNLPSNTVMHEKSYKYVKNARKTIYESADIEIDSYHNEEMDISHNTDYLDSRNRKELQPTTSTVVEQRETSAARDIPDAKLCPNKKPESQQISLYKKVLTKNTKNRKTIVYNDEKIDETIYQEQGVDNAQLVDQRQSQNRQKDTLCLSMAQDIDTQNGNNYEIIQKSHSTLADCKRKTIYEATNMQFDEQSNDIQEESRSYKSFNSSKKYKSTLVENDRMNESVHISNAISKAINNTSNRQTIFFSGAYIEEDKTSVNNGDRFVPSSHRVPFATKNKRQTICEPNDMDIDQETQYNIDHSNNVCISDKDNLNHKSVSHINRTQVIENKEDAPKNNQIRATTFFSNNERNEDRMDTTLSPENNDPPTPNVDKLIKVRKTIIFGECDNNINPDQSNLVLDNKGHASSFFMDQSKPELRAEPIDDTGTNPYILQVTPKNLKRTISFQASQYLSTPDVSRKGSRIIYQDKGDVYTPRRNLYETTADYFEAAELECFEELEHIAKDQSIAQDVAKECFDKSTKSATKSNKKPVICNKAITETEEVNNRVPKALLKDLRPSFKLSTENLHNVPQNKTETNEEHNASGSEENNKTKTTDNGTIHFAHENEDGMEISICGINNEIKLNKNGNNLTIKSENNNKNVKQTILFTKENIEISFDGDPHCDNDKNKEDVLHIEEHERTRTEVGSPLSKTMPNLSDSYSKKHSPRKVMFSKLKNICHPKRCIVFDDDMNASINEPSTSKGLQRSPVRVNVPQQEPQDNMDISFDATSGPNIIQIESNPNTENRTPILFKKNPRNSIFLINKNRQKSPIGTPDMKEASHNLDIDNITQTAFNNYQALLSEPDIENTRLSLIDSLSYEDETHISVESTNSICIIDGRFSNKDNEEMQPTNEDLCTNVENIMEEKSEKAINTSVQVNESLRQEFLCKKCRKCDSNRTSLGLIPLKKAASSQKLELDWSGYERYQNVSSFSDVFAAERKRRESMSFQYSAMENSFEESVLQPLVPSIEFLLENYAKQKNKELRDEQFEHDDDEGPVFPTDRSFIYLLQNKLENNWDWKLDDLLAANGILSFYHKRLKCFYLQLKYCPVALRTNSDIVFESVTLKDNPVYKKLTTIDTIMKSEILFKVPRDLKHLCCSSLNIFDLLDFVNGHYQNAFNAAKQLYRTVILCGASIETDFRESYYVKKSVKVKTESGTQVKDFKLKIYKIDKISYNDIKTPGLSNFKGTVKEFPAGLDFLPSFLNNPIEFLK